MSEEVKKEVEKVEEVGAKEEVKVEETKEETKVEEKPKKLDAEGVLGFSPFVTEDDRFDIVVKCYKQGKELVVEGVDSDFDDSKEGVKEITFTFKHPSQGDFNVIGANASAVLNIDDTAEPVNLNKLEFARLLVLIRTWSLPEELDNLHIIGLDPKIIKAIIFGLREKISLNGIF